MAARSSPSGRDLPRRAPERSKYGAVTALMSAAAGRKRQRKSAAPRPLAHRTDIRSADGGTLGSSDMVRVAIRSSTSRLLALDAPRPRHSSGITNNTSGMLQPHMIGPICRSERGILNIPDPLAVPRVVAADAECRAYWLQRYVLASAVRSSNHLFGC